MHALELADFVLFLSTLSLRRATAINNTQIYKHDDFYPRSPCGERPVQIVIIVMHALISIHALLAESDNLPSKPMERKLYFYPRSPCGERRQQPDGTTNTTYFYPRSPCGERQDEGQANQSGHCISIHALLAESDQAADISARRGASISIHALLAESDNLHPGYCALIH